jgi:hypothetical protein
MDLVGVRVFACVWLATVVGVGGCQKKTVLTSRLDVVIKADASLLLDQVQVTLNVTGRAPLMWTFDSPGSDPLRWEVIISNMAGPLDATIDARGRRAGSDVVVFDAGAIIGVNSHVVATIPLTASCANKFDTCSADQTCIDGTCATRPIFVNQPTTGGPDASTESDGGQDGPEMPDHPADIKTDGGSPDRGMEAGTMPDTATGTPAALSISPGTKDFGTIVTGLYGEASFQITNSGGQASSVPMVTIDGTDADSFTISNNGCMAAVPATGNCLVTVRFSPTTAAAKTARLNVSATMGGAVSASLQGLAVPPGALMITPSPQAFPPVLQGTPTAPITFTVKNTGGATTGMLAAAAIQGSTDFAVATDGCKNATLASMATCTITVTFTPSTATQESGTLVVSATPGGTTSASLTGVGLAPALLTIDPVSGTFGTTTVGATGGTQTFTITNSGGVTAGSTTGVNVAVTGAGAGDFTASGNTCTGMLAPTATCMVTITFKPSAAGARSATLTASATPGGSAPASLSGTGVNPAHLTLAPATGAATSFGSVVTGTSATQTFVVTNTGGQPSTALTISASGAGFSVATPGTGDCASGTTTLAVNGTCNVHVVLSSSTLGPVSGSLTASATMGGSATLTLSGTIVSQGNIVVSPTTSDFGASLPGVPSAPVTFTVTNNGGSATGTMTATITGSTEFTIGTDACSTKTLGASQTCAITVVFKPSTTPGLKTGSLSVSGTPGGTAAAQLMGTGLAPASLSISTPSGFGNVVVGQMSTQMLTITNSGDVAAGTTTAIAIALSGTNASEFSSTTCAATIGAKGTCTITVTFAPASAATGKVATLTVTGSPGGPVSASLTGNGLSQASLHLSVASGFSNEFGSLVVNASQTEQFVVTNTGQQPSSALTIALSGTDFHLVAPTGLDCVSGTTTLAPNASCTVRVTFTPTAAVSRTATLSVSATTGGSDSLTTLHGAGVNPSALTPNVTSINFGSVLQNGKSSPSAVTVTNTGGVTSGTISTSLPAGEFAIVNDGCKNATLAAGGSCSITLTFNPTSASATPKTNTLTISANPGGSPTVTLSGTGSTLGIDQASFVFPTTAVFGISAARSFTISNPSSVTAGTTTGLSATLTGASPSDFHIDSTTCSGSLGGGGLCTVVVSFRPGTFGNRTATLSVSSTPGGGVTAALSGQGQAADGQVGCMTGNDCGQSGVCNTYYPDVDGDTYGDPHNPLNVCGFTPPGGYVSNGQDCDDSNALMNVFTSRCNNTTTRAYCLDDAIVRTQTCSGGGCLGSYCIGTVSMAGIFTCTTNPTQLTCSTSQGCTYTSSGANPGGSAPACGMGNTGGSLITCDGGNDCPAGSVCCTDFNCGLTTQQHCFAGSCPASVQCTPWTQLCNPLAPDCPAGTTCQGGTSGDPVSGQGSWSCF